MCNLVMKMAAVSTLLTCAMLACFQNNREFYIICLVRCFSAVQDELKHIPHTGYTICVCVLCASVNVVPCTRIVVISSYYKNNCFYSNYSNVVLLSWE
jgi:hypothetical protein